MDFEELKKQLDKNSKQLEVNSKNIIDKMNRIHQNSGAIEILKDFKGDNKRIFIILLIVLFMWFSTIVYLVYVLNDTNILDTTTQEISDFETINGNVINRGVDYGEN